MIIGIKDALRLVGVTVIACTGVFVCTIFLNYYMDAAALRGSVPADSLALYNAQMAMAKTICGISGGCLTLIAAVMLTFYIRLYIDGHVKELGVLKAMGYPAKRLALSFLPFGLSVFIGAVLGFAGAFIAMPTVYSQLCGEELPAVAVSFRVSLLALMVFLPSAAFSALAVAYSYVRLKRPLSEMLKGKEGAGLRLRQKRGKGKGRKEERGESDFLSEMRRSVVRGKKSLAFFVAFAGFCFSAMVQMGLSMEELSTETMGAMILIIGLVLAFTSFFMAITALVGANEKNIAVMKAFGYPLRACSRAVFSGYRPFAYLGFGAGTLYQYGLLSLMLNVFFENVDYIPDYTFNFPVFFIVLSVFVLLYEGTMALYFLKIDKISVKIIMEE